VEPVNSTGFGDTTRRTVEENAYALPVDGMDGVEGMASVYLAGPVFTDAEIHWLRHLKSHLVDKLGNRVTVIWPFELTPKDSHDRAAEVLRICREGLDAADILIASLDGPQVDDGTAWEIGYFFHTKGSGVRIIGVRTDVRAVGETAGVPVNTLVEASCGVIGTTFEDLLNYLVQTDFLTKKIEREKESTR
jgi:nucleoside 2-deoxyribosyltransferase